MFGGRKNGRIVTSRIVVNGPMSRWRSVTSVSLKDLYWDEWYSIPSSVTETVGSSTSSASLQGMHTKLKVQLTHLRDGMPVRGTWTSSGSGTL